MCLGFVIDDSLPRLDGASVVMCAVCVFIYVCVYIFIYVCVYIRGVYIRVSYMYIYIHICMCIYKRHMQACVPWVTSTCVYCFGRICVFIMSMHVYLHFAVDDRQSCASTKLCKYKVVWGACWYMCLRCVCTLFFLCMCGYVYYICIHIYVCVCTALFLQVVCMYGVAMVSRLLQIIGLSPTKYWQTRYWQVRRRKAQLTSPPLTLTRTTRRCVRICARTRLIRVWIYIYLRVCL